MGERESLQYGLEFLGKVFALAEGNKNYARAAYAPVSQIDGLFDPQLERVPSAFTALEQGNYEAVKSLLDAVVTREATERANSNFAPGFQAHHKNGLGGLVMLTPDMTMSDSNQTFRNINDAGIYTGTNRHELVSGSSTLFHPAAHTHPETLRTGSYDASQAILSQHRQSNPTERAQAALSDLTWERDTSVQAFDLPGEQAIRSSLSNLTGIPIEDMMSTEVDAGLRKGGTRTNAASNTIRMRDAGQAPIVRGIVDEAKKQYGNELYIPKMVKTAWPSNPEKFTDWQLMRSPKEKDYMDEYLRIERPGLVEALDVIKGMQYKRR